MEIPEGLGEERGKGNSVCKLEKSLYGLKQAPRCWNQKFSSFLKEFEFTECEADQCIFVGKFEREIVYLGIFVDDGLVASRNIETIDYILGKLSETFEMTVGDSSVFVGIQIKHDRNEKKMLIHQSAYTKKIIEKFRMSDTKPLCVPADPNVKLAPCTAEDERATDVPFREAIGSLVFLASITRPDIAFAVNMVSRHTNDYTTEH